MYSLIGAFGDHLFLTLFGVLLTTLYLYFKNVNSHYARLGIEFIKPTLLFGNSWPLIKGKNSLVHNNQILYNAIKGKFGGSFIFTRPILIIKDPELINQILIKDFGTFTDRGFYINEEGDPLSAHLLAITGDKWRTMRNRLSPTFSSGKLKFYASTILDIADRLQNHITEVGNRSNVFEVRDLIARYTTDIITSVAFGAEVDSINNPDEVFRKIGELISNPQGGRIYRVLLSLTFPKLMKALGIKQIDQQIEDFIRNITEQSLKMREKEKVVRHDFMQLLVLLRNGSKVSDDGKWEVHEVPDSDKFLSVNQMMAQVFIFFLAGFETTASAISLALFEIAKQPAIQKQLHTEIDDVLKKHGGKLTYESVQEMKYLGQCFDEILRMYPSVPQLIRIAGRNYKIPDTDIILPKGDTIMVMIQAIQNDPKYFKNPDLFDPDRFAPENKAKIQPNTYLPFGDGPRNCIGMRLGLLQARIGLAAVFAKFHIDLAPGQASELKFDTLGFFTPIGGIKMAITPRD